MTDKPKLDLGVLEEDDEFEEFPVEGKIFQVNLKICIFLFILFLDWSGKDKDEQDISVWEDNWEDDNIEDDFNKQLRYLSTFILYNLEYFNFSHFGINL